MLKLRLPKPDNVVVWTKDQTILIAINAKRFATRSVHIVMVQTRKGAAQCIIATVKWVAVVQRSPHATGEITLTGENKRSYMRPTLRQE